MTEIPSVIKWCGTLFTVMMKYLKVVGRCCWTLSRVASINIITREHLRTCQCPQFLHPKWWCKSLILTYVDLFSSLNSSLNFNWQIYLQLTCLTSDASPQLSRITDIRVLVLLTLRESATFLIWYNTILENIKKSNTLLLMFLNLREAWRKVNVIGVRTPRKKDSTHSIYSG